MANTKCYTASGLDWEIKINDFERVGWECCGETEREVSLICGESRSCFQNLSVGQSIHLKVELCSVLSDSF